MSEAAEPTRLVQGDSTTWVRTWGAYPASEWSATWVWYGADATHSVAGVPDGDSFRVTLSAAETADWAEGLYRWGVRVESGSVVETLAEGGDTVVDLPLEARRGDPRGWAERALDAIEATLEGKASRDQLSMSIQGTSLSRMTWEEMIQARTFLRDLVDSGRRDRDIASGRRPTPRNPVIRM